MDFDLDAWFARLERGLDNLMATRLPDPLAPTLTTEETLMVSPAAPMDTIAVVPATRSTDCATQAITAAPTTCSLGQPPDAAATVMEHKDAHESAIPLTINPSTWYDHFSCAFLDASHCPEYFVNGVHMHVSAICSVLAVRKSQMLQLLGNLSSSVSCVMAKDQCSARARWSFNDLLLGVQEWAPAIQCVQHACVPSYALSWHERHTTNILLPVLDTGSIMALFLSGSPHSFWVADLLEGANQLKCTKGAQGLTVELLAKAAISQDIGACCLLETFYEKKHYLSCNTLMFEAKVPDATHGLFMNQHSGLDFGILGVLVTCPHLLMVQITELFSKYISILPDSMTSVDRLLHQLVLEEPFSPCTVSDHGYKWLIPWSKSENKALLSCYLTSHRHSAVVKWYMESPSLVVYKLYTDMNLSSTSFGMMRASPPGLDLMLEQIIVSFSQALISACFIDHINQCGSHLLQWKIAWTHPWECSQNASADLKEHWLLTVGEEVIQVNIMVAYYGVGGIATWPVFDIRFRPTETYSCLDEMKRNNGTRSSHILMLAFPEIPTISVVGLRSRFGTTIWLTWSRELMENKNFNDGTPFSCLNGGLICTFSVSMAGQTLLMPHKLRLPAQVLHRTISLTDKGSPSLIVVLLSFCGEQHRIGHLLQWKHIKLIRFFPENGVWVQSELNNKDITTHDASVGIAARIPYSTNKMDFYMAGREPMILQHQCFGWISSGFILLCSGRATLLTDQFDDKQGMLSRKKYQVLAQRTEVPWDPGGLFMMSAWGQAAFQGGRDVRSLSYRYMYMGWSPGATTWAWPSKSCRDYIYTLGGNGAGIRMDQAMAPAASSSSHLALIPFLLLACSSV